METPKAIINKRSSCFDYDFKEKTVRKFPDDNDVLVYPSEYTEKVTDEIEQWKTYAKEIASDQKEFVKRKRELKSTLYDESVLSQEQRDFLESVGFNNYIQQAEQFCERLALSAEINNYQEEDIWQTLTKSANIQKKIKSEITSKYFK